MSLFPYFFRDMMRPLRMLENQMRMSEEMFNALSSPFYRINRSQNALEDSVMEDKEKIQIKLDVQHFTPEEITVKTFDNNAIQIQAKHEEKQDGGKSFISREFVRRFVLPEGHDVKKLVSSFSSDGVLTLTAPKILKQIEEKNIPITHIEGEEPKDK